MSDFYSLATIIRPSIPLSSFPLTFYSSSEDSYLQLCIVKRDGLEIWSTDRNNATTSEKTTLSLSLSIPVYDRILKVLPIPNITSATDSLFILTTSLQYCLLSSPTPITLEKGNMEGLVMPGLLLPKPLITADTQSSKTTSFIAMHVSQGLIDLIIIDTRRADPRIQTSPSSPNPHIHQRRIEEIEIIDFTFIPNSLNNSTTLSSNATPRSLLAILHIIPGGIKEISLYDISISHSGSPTIERSIFIPPSSIPPSSNFLIPLARGAINGTNSCGLLIVGDEEIEHWIPTTTTTTTTQRGAPRGAPQHQAIIATIPTKWTSYTIVPKLTPTSSIRIIMTCDNGHLFCLFLDPLSITFLGKYKDPITSLNYHTNGQLFTTTSTSSIPVLINLLTEKSPIRGGLIDWEEEVEVEVAGRGGGVRDCLHSLTIKEEISLPILDISSSLKIVSKNCISDAITVDTEMISTTILSFMENSPIEGRWKIFSLSDGVVYLYCQSFIYSFDHLNGKLISYLKCSSNIISIIEVDNVPYSINEDGIYSFNVDLPIFSAHISMFSQDDNIIFILLSSGEGIVYDLKNRRIIDLGGPIKIPQCPSALLLKDMVLYYALWSTIISLNLRTAMSSSTSLPSLYISSIGKFEDHIMIADCDGRWKSYKSGMGGMVDEVEWESLGSGGIGPITLYSNRHSCWALSMGFLFFLSSSSIGKKKNFIFSGKKDIIDVRITSNGQMLLLRTNHIEIIDAIPIDIKKNLLLSYHNNYDNYLSCITSSLGNTIILSLKSARMLLKGGGGGGSSVNVGEYIFPSGEEGTSLTECHSFIIVSTTKRILTFSLSTMDLITSFTVLSEQAPPSKVLGMVVWNYKIILIAIGASVLLYRLENRPLSCYTRGENQPKQAKKSPNTSFLEWTLESEFLCSSNITSIDSVGGDDRIVVCDALYSINVIKICLGNIGEDFKASLNFVELGRSRDPSFRYKYSSPTVVQFLDESNILVSDDKERISVFRLVPRSEGGLRVMEYKLKLVYQIFVGEMITCMKRGGGGVGGIPHVLMGSMSGSIMKFSLLLPFKEIYNNLLKVQSSLKSGGGGVFDALYCRKIFTENNNDKLLDLTILSNIAQMSPSEKRKHLQHLSFIELRDLSSLLEELGNFRF